MTLFIRLLNLGILMIGLPIMVFSQSNISQNKSESLLPKIFILGENEEILEKTLPKYEQLLNVCDNDIKVAFEKWLSMMLEMEAYAEESEYDLRGIKIWIRVFWASNGVIEHIGFHLKPNSRQVDVDKLKPFFSSFTDGYQFPLENKGVKYTHYTAIGFPIFAKKISKN